MRPQHKTTTFKKIKYPLTGVLLFALMHVYTSITSKEEVSPHLPENHPVLDGFVSEFHELTSSMFMNSKSPGAAIAVVKNGKIVYEKGFGFKRMGSPDSIDKHTIFRIASVSKTFAGVLTGKMVAHQKLNWNDNVHDYYPQFSLKNPEYAKKMKVRHILSQTTGLIQHAYTNFIEEGKELNTMLAALPEVKLMTSPGRLFSYQNVAFGVIEPILESATGEDYASLLHKEIFEPLMMHDASVNYQSMIANDNIAYPHFPRRRGWVPGTISTTYYNVPSAGGINASISDMANYMIALTGHRSDVLSKEVLKEVFKPQVRTNIRLKYFSRWKDYKKSYYGLGWRIVENGESTIAYHGGYVNGYRSHLAINTADDIGICVLTNSPTSFSSRLVPAFLSLYDEYREHLKAEEASQITLVHNQ